MKQVSWWNADKILSCFPALKNCSTMFMLEAHKWNIYPGVFDLFCWGCFLIKLQYSSYWNLTTEQLNCSLLCRYRTGEWGDLRDILLYIFPIHKFIHKGFQVCRTVKVEIILLKHRTWASRRYFASLNVFHVLHTKLHQLLEIIFLLYSCTTVLEHHLTEQTSSKISLQQHMITQWMLCFKPSFCHLFLS